MLPQVHWVIKMKKDNAIEIQKHALNAISELSLLLNLSKEACTGDEFEQIRKGVGFAIGDIQVEILDVLINEFPELDDLKK